MSGSHIPSLGETLGKACEVANLSLEAFAASIGMYDPALTRHMIDHAKPAPAGSDVAQQLVVVIERVVKKDERPWAGDVLVEFLKASQQCLAPATIQHPELVPMLNDLARHMARIALEDFGLLDVSKIE